MKPPDPRRRTAPAGVDDPDPGAAPAAAEAQPVAELPFEQWDVQPAAATGPPSTALDEAIRVVRARKWLMLATILLATGAALGLSLAAERDYSATATLLFEAPATADFLGSEVGREDDPERAAVTRGELLSLDMMARRTARALGAGISPGEVSERVKIHSREDLDVVDIEATAASGELAARIANTYARTFIALRERSDRGDLERGIRRLRAEFARLSLEQRTGSEGRALSERIAELRSALPLQTGNVELVQRAGVPREPEASHLVRNVAAGLALGALMALGLAWLLERIDRRVKSAEEFEELYDLPLLARIPRSRDLARYSRRHEHVDLLGAGSRLAEEAEAFRALRATLRHIDIGRELRSLLVVSPMAGEGKSTIARFLALAMAGMGDSVALVDADLRKPDHNRAAVATNPKGLSLVLTGLDLDEALIEVPVEFDPASRVHRSLVELSSGPLPPNPSELLESARMRWVIHQLEARFERVIIDSPALASLSDAVALVPEVSAILIVGAVNQTTRKAALELQRELTLVGGTPIGVVANFWRPAGEPPYQSYAS